MLRLRHAVLFLACVLPRVGVGGSGAGTGQQDTAPRWLDPWLEGLSANIAQPFHSYAPLSPGWSAARRALYAFGLEPSDSEGPQATRFFWHYPRCTTNCTLLRHRVGALGACPGSATVGCKRLLAALLRPGETWLPETYTSDQKTAFLAAAKLHPNAMWFLKGHQHGRTFMVPAREAAATWKAAPGSVAVKQLEDPWLYKGRVTTARAHVAVSHDPLRVHIIDVVRFQVSPQPYNPRDPCTTQTNLFSYKLVERADACRMPAMMLLEKLLWVPYSNASLRNSQVNEVKERYLLTKKYTQVLAARVPGRGLLERGIGGGVAGQVGEPPGNLEFRPSRTRHGSRLLCTLPLPLCPPIELL